MKELFTEGLGTSILIGEQLCFSEFYIPVAACWDSSHVPVIMVQTGDACAVWHVSFNHGWMQIIPPYLFCERLKRGRRTGRELLFWYLSLGRNVEN